MAADSLISFCVCFFSFFLAICLFIFGADDVGPLCYDFIYGFLSGDRTDDDADDVRRLIKINEVESVILDTNFSLKAIARACARLLQRAHRE